MKLKRLIKLNDIKTYDCEAADGEIGSYEDMYFDDTYFAVRFLLINTQKWLQGRKILLSPFTVGSIDEQNRLMYIELAQQQIKNSPPLGTNQTVSRHYEEKYFEYYDWPPYWDTISWPSTLPLRASAVAASRLSREISPHYENHLHRASQILDCVVSVSEGIIGKLTNFVIDTHYWVIRYLEIDTHNRMNGTNTALVTPTLILSINWPENRISVDISLDNLQNAPRYDANKPISRDYESRLLQYYGERIYWK
jgi:hypothetical protein